ncbi:MAG: hypothetical protein KDB00_26265 [Planctomycetales bacterium]|nr:hypothetical protein [Planctomycetales bacterium]
MLESVCDSIRRARDSWRGCDWVTEFGPRRLNLCGLQSRQALLAAKATRGDESQCWKAAADWLILVEKDANHAGEIALGVIDMIHRGDVSAASRLLDRAVTLESKYPTAGHYRQCRSLFEGYSQDPATVT